MATKGVNKVILVGNLGNKPELRYTSNGHAVANVSLATNMSWRNKQTGEMQEHTEWHRVVFFNRLAEITNQYLNKGSQIYIEGRLQTRKWQDNTGADRYTTEIVAQDMQMLDSRNGGGSPGNSAEANAMMDADAHNESAPEMSNVGNVNDFEDDIPF